MTRKRRSFTPEFKQEAASLVLDQGYTIAQAGTSLGVGESAMRRWVQQLTDEREGITPKGKALTPEQRRIQELEARCKRLEMEKTILKKATVSSTGQRKYTL
jgi:transposase